MNNLIEGIYCFDGNAEFNVEVKQQASMLKAYSEASERPVTEWNLSVFGKWFKSLRFSSYMDENGVVEDVDITGSKFFWHFKVVYVNPVVKATGEKVGLLKSSTEKALEFYKSIFTRETNDLKSMKTSVLFDPSIMLVALKSKNPSPPGTVMGNKKKRREFSTSVVVSCITFRPSNRDKPGPVFITWLGVAPYNAQAPVCMKQWRRNGFGQFSLIQVIKRLSVNNEQKPTDVPIYLQCTEESSFQFYTSIGFVELSDDNENGLTHLPDSLRKVVDKNVVFLPVVSQGICRMLLLSTVKMLKPFDHPEVVTVENNASEVPKANPNDVDSTKANEVDEFFTWCQFPAPRILSSGHVVSLTTHDVNECLTGLDAINALVPPTSGRLLPSGALRIAGDVSFTRRLLHSEQGGKSWMSNSELELISALTFRDGRYDTSVLQVRSYFMEYIQEAFLAELEMKRMLLWKSELPDGLSPNDIESKIEEHFGETSQNITKSWHSKVEWLERNMHLKVPTQFQKKMIVFTINVDSVHWKTFYVLHPLCIDIPLPNSDDDEEEESFLKCCFYRYCGFDASGGSEISNKYGIIWFLNMMYSYYVHFKDDPMREEQVIMKRPFGETESVEGNITGTNIFPSLQLHSPIIMCQPDNWSCGIAITTTTAILCRDLFSDWVPKDKYEAAFCASNLPLGVTADNSEVCVPFPVSLLNDEEIRLDKKINKHLFHQIKQEWFLLFDRMARKIHVEIPQRLGFRPKYTDPFWKCSEKLIDKWPGDNRPFISMPTTLKSTVEVVQVQRTEALTQEEIPNSITFTQSPSTATEKQRKKQSHIDRATAPSPMPGETQWSCELCAKFMAFFPMEFLGGSEEVVKSHAAPKFWRNDVMDLFVIGYCHTILGHSDNYCTFLPDYSM